MTNAAGLQPLIDALREGTASQQAEALATLKLLSGENFGDDAPLWQRWWDLNRSAFLGGSGDPAPPPTSAEGVAPTLPAPPAVPPLSTAERVTDPPPPQISEALAESLVAVRSGSHARRRAPRRIPWMFLVGLGVFCGVMIYMYLRLQALGVLDTLQKIQ